MGTKAGLDQESKRIPCLCLPQREQDLLLPSVAVAEVDAVEYFSPSIQKAPWLYGVYNWHDVPIPLIDMDVLLHEKSPLEQVRYIGILHSQEEQTDIPFFCVVMQGIPSQSLVEYGDLQLREVEHSDYAIADLEFDEKLVILPDLKALEQKLRTAL